MPKHFIEIDDLNIDEINEVLQRSEDAKPDPVLKGKTATLLFEKPSTRTRQSMEAAIVQLGGHPVYVQPLETGIDERESAEDVGKTLSLFNAVIAARVFEHSKLERMSTAANVPIINLLSDTTHPIQTLADLLTIKQLFGDIKDVSVTYVGDPNNVSRSLAIGLSIFGNKLKLARPQGYGFNELDRMKFDSSNVDIEVYEDPLQAVENADVVYTDAWYSMGQEEQKARRISDFENYQINSELMRAANGKAVFMHCLPAHRGYEVTDEVIDGDQSVVWKQAENRMHSARGLISFLCS